MPASACETGQPVFASSAISLERLGGEAGNDGVDVEVAAGDPDARLEGHGGAGVHPLRRGAVLAQRVRERHAEARRVCGRDELLRGGRGVAALAACLPVDGEGAEVRRRERDGARALREGSGPGGGRFAGDGHDSSGSRARSVCGARSGQPIDRAASTGTVAQAVGRRATEESRALQEQVDLAAEAERERGVQERGDEGGGRRDRQCPRHADQVQDEPDRDDEEPDTLREARRTRVLELGRGRETRTDEAAEHDAPRCGRRRGDAPEEQERDHDGEEEAWIECALRERRGGDRPAVAGHEGRVRERLIREPAEGRGPDCVEIPIRARKVATSSSTVVIVAANRGPRGSMPAGVVIVCSWSARLRRRRGRRSGRHAAGRRGIGRGRRRSRRRRTWSASAAR